MTFTEDDIHFYVSYFTIHLGHPTGTRNPLVANQFDWSRIYGMMLWITIFCDFSIIDSQKYASFTVFNQPLDVSAAFPAALR
tara:strand:+ start:261 stop:506 length:246 start_codon:yes stop_codon:yes gene_type:complete